MADAFQDEDSSRPRRVKKKKAKEPGMSTAMILLILFGSLAGLAIVACCGIGGAGYFFVQKAMKDVDLKNPADIQRVTSEMIDITIPAEFVPKHASSIFVIKSAEYEWCPTGTCAPRDDGLGTMTLTSMEMANQPGQTDSGFPGPDVSEDMLKRLWRDYTKTDHEFTIRGRKCPFTIIHGEQIGFVDVDDSEMEAESDEAQPSANTAAEKTDSPTETAPDAGQASSSPPGDASPPAQKQVQISGHFPGKKGECMILIHLAPEQYEEQKILDMLKSIR